MLVRYSKFLSLVLRHKPEKIGFSLDEAGWADVDDLLRRSQSHGVALDRETLEHVVANNDKKRFALSEDGSRIRASQGHSLPVDLGLQGCTPPTSLYHGTATRFLAPIMKEGLLKRGRQHVHLSAEIHTAQKVGTRHGKPVILEVASGRMFEDGYQFFLSANNVWLTDHVPTTYLQELDL